MKSKECFKDFYKHLIIRIGMILQITFQTMIRILLYFIIIMLILLLQREMQNQIQSAQTLTKKLSRNSLLSQGNSSTTKTASNLLNANTSHYQLLPGTAQVQQRDKMNHYLTQFNTFKSHQWSKLNLELNQSRAQTTIQKMVDFDNARQDIKSQKEQEKMRRIIQEIKDQREKTKEVINNNISTQDDKFLNSQMSLNNNQESTLLLNNQAIISKDQSIEDNNLTQIKSKSALGLRKFSDQTINGQNPYQNNNPNNTKIKKYQRQAEISQLRSSLNQLNILQQIGSVNILKEFKYPQTIEGIVNYIKEKDLDLYEKIRQTKSLVNARFVNDNQVQEKDKISKVQSKQQLQQFDSKFVRQFTMNERQQLCVLKNWLEYMIENYVKCEDPKFVQRLTNEQLILIFTLSDLRDQLTTECSERGELVEKVLALFFDMFKSYDLSFDKIIEQELNIFKEGIRAQNQQKDQSLRQKEKELDKAFQKAKEIEDHLENNNNKVQALLAQKKASEIRFKVTRNLIDNLIFNYKQKIQKLYAKHRDCRIMARDFIYELKELKRFSEKDDNDMQNDKSFDEMQEQDKAMKNMKKKFNKCTQTVQVINKNKTQTDMQNTASQIGTGSIVTQDIKNSQVEVQIKQKRKRNRKNKSKQTREKKIKNGQEEDINLEGFDFEEQNNVDQNLDDNQSQDNQQDQMLQLDDDQEHDSEDDSNEEYLYDEHGNLINNNNDNDTIQVQNQQLNMSNIDSEGNDILDEKSEQALNEEEKEQMQQQQQLFQILEEYEPQEVLDMIAFFNYQKDKENIDKDIQTDNNNNNNMLESGSILERNSSNNNDNTDLDNIRLPQEPKSTMPLHNRRGQKHHRQSTNTPQNTRARHSGTFIQSPSQEGLDLQVDQSNNDSMGTDSLNNGHKINKQASMSSQNLGVTTSLFKNNSIIQQITLSKQQSSNEGGNNNQDNNNNSPLRRKTTLNKIRNQELSSLTVEEILDDLQNIEVNDLEIMLGSDNKIYKKRSMQFLTSLVSELKKTKIFKGMVEKAAKDKLREEEKKEQQKQERWINKKSGNNSGAGSKVTSPSNNKSAQRLGSNTNNKSNQASSFHNAANQARVQSQSNKNTKGNVIIEEELSSQSSDSERGTGTYRTIKQKIQLKNNSNKNSANKNHFKANKKKSIPKNQIVNDKGIQVNTYQDEIKAMEQIKQTYMNMHIKNNSSIDSQGEIQQIPSPQVNIQMNINDDQTPTNQNSFGAKLTQLFRRKLESTIMQTNPNLISQLPYKQLQQQQLNNQGVTVAVPFNLGHQRTKKAITQHPMTKLLPLFIEKFAQNDKKFLNVNQMTIKQLLKFIQQFYIDKYTNARDSLLVRHQMMSEFIYDQLFNKYGIANITEKKLKEIFITIKYNQQKNLSVALFSKFTGLDELNYSNDDLTFYFKLNRLMVFGDCFQQAIRRDINLESANIIFQNSYEVFIGFFQKKVQPKTFTKLQEDLQMNIKPHAKLPPPGSNAPVLIPTEIYFEVLINIYRSIKQKLLEYLIQLEQLHIFTSEDDLQYPQCLYDKTFDYEEFNKLMTILISQAKNIQDQIGFQEHIPLLFERNRIQSQSQDEKRITLENVLRIIFKHDIIIL